MNHLERLRELAALASKDKSLRQKFNDRRTNHNWFEWEDASKRLRNATLNTDFAAIADELERCKAAIRKLQTTHERMHGHYTNREAGVLAELANERAYDELIMMDMGSDFCPEQTIDATGKGL